MAILFDRLLSYLQHTSFKRTAIILGSAIVIIGGFLVVPLFNSDEDDLVIAGKIGAEPEILMNAYKLLIEQGTKLSAEVEPNFGKTTFVFNALRSGEIDIYTEFTGTVLGNFFDIVPEPGVSKEAVYEEARDKLQDEYDMTLLDPMAFNNTYALAVTSDFAEKYDLKTISDLKPVQNEVNAGFTLEFNDREDGYPGIQKMYDLSFGEVITMEPQLRYEATEQGDVNVIDAYSTDSQIEVYDLVVLEDDMGLFPPYQGAPLMLTELIEEHPEVEDVLSVLDGAITSAQMREMNYQVDVEDRSAEEVAREFLTEEGFLEE